MVGRTWRFRMSGLVRIGGAMAASLAGAAAPMPAAVTTADAAVIPGETGVLLQSRVNKNGVSNKQKKRDNLFSIKLVECLFAHNPYILWALFQIVLKNNATTPYG